ncbi:MAG: thioredoxin-related protein [Yoonia sp.]|jgi:thioredoxin-related protein
MFRLFALIAILFTSSAALADVGDDGLHEADWIRETFKDLREDHVEAEAEGKTLMIIVEQRGCIYCTKMHEDIFPIPEINAALHDNFFVVQINMFGDVDVTDFDGTTLPEKDMVRRWNALFTPLMIFMPSDVAEDATATGAAAAVMPGAFGKWTTLNLFNWIAIKGYEGDEPFQRYHARMLQEAGIVE